MTDLTPLQETPEQERRGDQVKIQTSEENFFYGGEEFSDWKEIVVNRSMTTASGSFKMQAAHSRPWPLRPGSGVAISVAGELVLSGAVDGLKSLSRGDDRSLSFVGRDATADLVDCSQRNEPGEWLGLTARKLIEQICKPFGIPVHAQGALGNTDADVLPLFRVQPGERAWAAIERILRLKGLIAYADGAGGLLISQVGMNYADAELLEGEFGNVVESDIAWNHVGRYSEYIVRGQAPGSDAGWGDAVIGPTATSYDEAVSRYRPLVVLAEGPINEADAKLRSQWEAAYRAAKAATLTVKVQGWRQVEGPAEGRVWAVNELVHCTIPSQGLNTQMLVDTLTFTRNGADGSQTSLGLVRPDAYRPKPAIASEDEAFADFLGEEDPL